MKVERYLNTNTKIYIMVLLISLSLIILGGTSYALVQRALTGTNTYSLQTGNFLVEFNETDVITLSNQVPVYDNVGLNSENEFSFTVTNTGNYNASYSIKIENNSTDSIGEVIRYAVNYGDGYSYDNVHALTNNIYVIQNKSLGINQSDSYSIKFWLDIDAPEVYINQQFNGRIVIEATQEEYKYGTNVLDAVYNLANREGLEAVGTNGSLYTSGDIREYRYSGATPINYVWFNCADGYTSGSDHCEKWRIIGSFLNTYENGVGEYRVLKIVRDAALTTTYPYNSNSSKLGNFEGSSIQTYLNGTYYNSLSASTKNLVMKANFNIGATLNTNTAISSYNAETSLQDYNYVGLINASDFGYAGTSNLWSTALNTTSFTSSNNWLYQANSMILNTSSLAGTNMYYLSANGLTSGTTSTSYNVRPVVYLKPDVSIIGGYGTSDEPYELDIKFAMTYGTKTEIKAASVTYNVNGGIGKISKTYIGQPITSEVPTKEGYNFIGWSTNPDAEEPEYQSGDAYTGGSVTLYAVWYKKPPTAAEIIIEKVVSYSVASPTTFTGGLVAINTNGTLYNETDTSQTIREYRYSGATVNNYVYFNCADIAGGYNYGDANYPYNETNCELWRIVGIFKNTQGEWNLKLMRNTVLQASELVKTYTINGTTYNIQYTTSAIVYWNNKTSGTINNDWTTAGLQYFLNTNQDTNGTKGYYSTISSSSKLLIDEIYTYYLGNVIYNTDTTITAYNNERGKTVCASSVTSNSYNSNCNIWYGNQPSWPGAIALLYPSDYGYSAHSSYWSGTKLYDYDGSAVKATNWMQQTANHTTEWLLSPSSRGSDLALNGISSGKLNASSTITLFGGRPVLNLKSETTSLAGRDGSVNLPYVIIGR